MKKPTVQPVEFFLDAFCKRVKIGDTVIYYSGNKGSLIEGKVKSIKYAIHSTTYNHVFHIWRIVLESGSVITNPNVVMKAT